VIWRPERARRVTALGQNRPRRARRGEPSGARNSPIPGRVRRYAESFSCIYMQGCSATPAPAPRLPSLEAPSAAIAMSPLGSSDASRRIDQSDRRGHGGRVIPSRAQSNRAAGAAVAAENHANCRRRRLQHARGIELQLAAGRLPRTGKALVRPQRP
jgi:hypothetical protein